MLVLMMIRMRIKQMIQKANPIKSPVPWCHSVFRFDFKHRACRSFPLIVLLPILMLALTSCERFRHEKYTCQPNSLGLVELIINDDRAGTEMSVVEVDREYTMTIGSITETELITANDQMILLLSRETGKVKVTIGSVAMTVSCEKSVFTM